MNALLANWNALPPMRKALVALAGAATLALMFYIAQGASKPKMSLLYGGLDQRAAGQVVAALDQLGVQSEVRGDQIYVPASQRDRARLDLARQGLPQMGQAGYELLDQLSGFGTTSEMFQAAYWRAKEGELARTILSVPGVSYARVHIGAQARRPFGRGESAATAAVTVRTSGGALTQQTAVSVRFLVALAVSNLAPQQVAVIDADNGVVLRPGEDNVSAAADAGAERRAAQLKDELERLLSVRVGPDNVQVSVSVELNKERSTLQETLVDPESQVTVSSEVEEQTERSAGGDPAVTIASELPDGDGAAAGQRNSQRERTLERAEFRYSETRRNQILEAGGVKRLGVAVLVNQIREVAEDGSVSFAPRPAEELAAIEELVKSAIAFNETRGDIVTVESMAFAALPDLGSAAETSTVERFVDNNLMTLVQLGVLALTMLLLGLFVVRPILTAQAATADEAVALEPAPAGGALVAVDGEPDAPAAVDGETPAIGETETGAIPAPESPAELENAAAPRALPNMTENELIAANEAAAELQTVERLRRVVTDRNEESAQLLAKWLRPEALPGGAQ